MEARHLSAGTQLNKSGPPNTRRCLLSTENKQKRSTSKNERPTTDDDGRFPTNDDGRRRRPRPRRRTDSKQNIGSSDKQFL